MFHDGEYVILNENARIGLPNNVGEIVEVYCTHANSTNYDYTIELDDGKSIIPVREKELTKLTEDQRQLMTYIKKNNHVIYAPANEKVRISKVDFIHGQAEVDFLSGGSSVVGFETLRKIENDGEIMVEQPEKAGYFADLGFDIGKLVDDKQKAYGDSVTKCYEIMKVLLQDYKNPDNTYTIPESIIPIMLLEVRKIDKMNRRFSNPDGDLMSENPFLDDVGYSMLGVRLMDQLHNAK
jgi:hypothetical protein